MRGVPDDKAVRLSREPESEPTVIQSPVVPRSRRGLLAVELELRQADAENARLRATVAERDAEIERLRAKLAAPCGSCHPCTEWANETWVRAGRRLPHLHEWDEAIERAVAAEATVARQAAALDAVRAVHERNELATLAYCRSCERDWPCATAAALAAPSPEPQRLDEGCAAEGGQCSWVECPQGFDGEPICKRRSLPPGPLDEAEKR